MPGGKRRVADNGLGIRMLIMRVGVVDAVFDQVPEPAFSKALCVAGGHITAQLVHGDLKDKFGWCEVCCCSP